MKANLHVLPEDVDTWRCRGVDWIQGDFKRDLGKGPGTVKDVEHMICNICSLTE